MNAQPAFDPQVDPALDLVLERSIDVPPSLVWKAWTTPEHLMCWFTPDPWKTIACEIDLRPGGIFSTTMQSPDGDVMPAGAGCYLEVVPERRLVWTDALGPGYRPNAEPFMTAMLLIEPEGDGTRYTAIAKHLDPETRQRHEEMGFFDGWGTVVDQLVAYVKAEM